MDNSKKKETTFVSIGIPFYNSEDFLEDAILSVINQTYTNWELLLIDDGSTDDSLKIARSFANKHSRIFAFSDGKNQGLPKRLNQLMNLIKGDYYFRMDADDIMHPQRLEKQTQFLIENPDVDIVGSALISIGNKNNILGKRSLSTAKKYNLSELIKGTWCVHPTIAGKPEYFMKNPYDTRLKRAQDYDLWLRTIDNHVFKKLDHPLLYYREASTPSFKKYYISTQNSILIYWKNRRILGSFRSTSFMLMKIFKLGIYFFYNIFNATDKIVQRRYVALNREESQEFEYFLLRAIKKTGECLR